MIKLLKFYVRNYVIIHYLVTCLICLFFAIMIFSSFGIMRELPYGLLFMFLFAWPFNLWTLSFKIDRKDSINEMIVELNQKIIQDERVKRGKL